MNHKLNVLLAGRSRTELEQIARHLDEHPWVRLSVQHISNGHSDPLHNHPELPDALIFCLSDVWEEELSALSERTPTARPTSLIVGPANDVHALRGAMQAGARDFLTQPPSPAELIASLKKIAAEQSTHESATTKVTAVINAKGGSGATLITTNLAHIMAAYGHMSVSLMDLDLQFGTAPLYLDIGEQRGMIDALKTSAELDHVSLQALMATHASGLQVLGAMSEEVVLPSEFDVESLERVRQIAAKSSEHIFMDLPRQIDVFTSHVLERAHRVLVVTQQSVTHMREAKRLMSILTRDLSVPSSQVQLVVNRYEPQGMISLRDFENSLGCTSAATVPNDFKHVAESVNLGIPLFELAPKSAITKALTSIADDLSGKPKIKRGRLFRRTVSTFGMESR